MTKETKRLFVFLGLLLHFLSAHIPVSSAENILWYIFCDTDNRHKKNATKNHSFERIVCVCLCHNHHYHLIEVRNQP